MDERTFIPEVLNARRALTTPAASGPFGHVDPVLGDDLGVNRLWRFVVRDHSLNVEVVFVRYIGHGQLLNISRPPKWPHTDTSYVPISVMEENGEKLHCGRNFSKAQNPCQLALQNPVKTQPSSKPLVRAPRRFLVRPVAPP